MDGKRNIPPCHKGFWGVKIFNFLVPFIHLLMCSGEDSKTDAFKIKSSEFGFFSLFLKPTKTFVHCLILF